MWKSGPSWVTMRFRADELLSYFLRTSFMPEECPLPVVFYDGEVGAVTSRSEKAEISSFRLVSIGPKAVSCLSKFDLCWVFKFCH